MKVPGRPGQVCGVPFGPRLTRGRGEGVWWYAGYRHRGVKVR
jgi:hypothetical protein